VSQANPFPEPIEINSKSSPTEMDPFAISQSRRKFIIPAMLIFGTCTTLTQKFMIEQKGEGSPKYGSHKFNKPWYFTLIMFIGMLLALIVYEIGVVLQRNRARNALNEEVREVHRMTSRLKTYLIIAIPACCDLLATGVMNIGLLYIQASAWQILRGAMTVFSSILHRFVLKRVYRWYMWGGVAIVFVSLIVVGLATVCSRGVAVDGASDGKVVLAIVLTVSSQFIRACEIVLEDYLLHDQAISPLLIVGVKGLWGTIITGGLVLPAAQWLFKSKEEGNGISEDTGDTFKRLGSDPVLIVLSILYIFFILGLNTFAMLVTNITNAVMRTITESLRTACIWIAQLVLFYSIEKSTYGHHHPTLGESWSVWSWLQLTGFGLLVTGMLAYNGTIRLPFFEYSEETPTEPDRSGNAGDMKSGTLSAGSSVPLILKSSE
jgi:drug/metabolite transporter (DMT)-like permease